MKTLPFLEEKKLRKKLRENNARDSEDLTTLNFLLQETTAVEILKTLKLFLEATTTEDKSRRKDFHFFFIN